MTTIHCTDPRLDPQLLLDASNTRSASLLDLRHLRHHVDDYNRIRHQCLLLRLFRALDTLFDGDLQAEKHWLDSHHPELVGPPSELLSLTDGLQKVVALVEKEAIAHSR